MRAPSSAHKLIILFLEAILFLVCIGLFGINMADVLRAFLNQVRIFALQEKHCLQDIISPGVQRWHSYPPPEPLVMSMITVCPIPGFKAGHDTRPTGQRHLKEVHDNYTIGPKEIFVLNERFNKTWLVTESVSFQQVKTMLQIY